MFITQDEIDHYFLREGVESRLTIYSHFCYPHSTEERQKFIKGSFGEYSGGARAGYQHTKTSKGLEYERDYNSRKYDTIRLTIPNVVKEYKHLIAQKRFPGEDAIAKIPEYERGQLARTVYNGFYNAPDDVPRPYPNGADYYDALPMIEEQLQDKGKTAEILAALTSRLDGTDESDRFYDSVRRAKEQLSEYVDGTFSLFNHRHDAQLVKAAVQTASAQTTPDAVGTVSQEPTQLETDTGTSVGDISIGTRLTIDGRQFEVDSVDDHTQNVSLRDVTFEGGTGFPIFRKESIDYVRAHMEQSDIAQETTAPQTDEPPAVLTPPKKKKQNALAYPLDADGRNYRITDDHVGEGAPLERFQRNLDAIRTLKTVEAESRASTAEEQAVLAQYVGWGGLADFFDEKNPRYAELKELLTDAEYAAARESTLTAFYTPPVVIRGIYAALGQMGFTQGNILEPACGIGNFLGMLPESMSGSKLYGVELDNLSGRIARQLYQRSSKKVKGNKTWANNMLPTIRKEWTEKLLQEATASQQSASPSGPSSAAISFVDFLYQWLEYKYKSATGRVMDSKPIELSTYSGYEQQLNNPIAPYFREHPVALCDLTKQDILAFYEKELERVKPTTVKHYHALIHGALNYAVDKNLIPSNPADRIIISKPEPFKGDYYLDSEVLNLFEVIKGHKIELVVLLTAFYGLRRSEVIGLKWSAFDFNHNCFSIRHTVTTCNVKGERVTIKKDKAKNKSSLRTYPLIPFLKERLLEAKKQQEENRKLCGRAYNKEYLGYVCVDVIGNLIKPNYVSSTFGKLLAKNNLRHIRFHDLRHTCASLLLANGVPMEQVKEWLGHSEISTTVDIYGHLQYATKKQSAAAIEQDIVAPMLQNLSAVSP